MHRIFLGFCLLLLLLSCGIGSKMAMRPRVELFLVPGATGVEISRMGWNEWQISYYAPGSPTTWSSDVAHQLEAQHWSSPDRVEYGSLSRTYNYASSLGCIELWEWAYLTFEPSRPHAAKIRVRRWIAIPWPQNLPRVVGNIF
jgi:hypothetical protein